MSSPISKLYAMKILRCLVLLRFERLVSYVRPNDIETFDGWRTEKVNSLVDHGRIRIQSVSQSLPVFCFWCCQFYATFRAATALGAGSTGNGTEQCDAAGNGSTERVLRGGRMALAPNDCSNSNPDGSNSSDDH